MGLGPIWKIGSLVALYGSFGIGPFWLLDLGLSFGSSWARGKMVILPQVWIVGNIMEPNF